MPNHYNERWNGPIRGLLLPLPAWNSLQDVGIRTLDELRAAANRLEQLPGIGAKTAQVIRAELARVSAAEGSVLG
jgi:endonuclease III